MIDPQQHELIEAGYDVGFKDGLQHGMKIALLSMSLDLEGAKEIIEYMESPPVIPEPEVVADEDTDIKEQIRDDLARLTMTPPYEEMSPVDTPEDVLRRWSAYAKGIQELKDYSDFEHWRNKQWHKKFFK